MLFGKISEPPINERLIGTAFNLRNKNGGNRDISKITTGFIFEM